MPCEALLIYAEGRQLQTLSLHLRINNAMLLIPISWQSACIWWCSDQISIFMERSDHCTTKSAPISSIWVSNESYSHFGGARTKLEPIRPHSKCEGHHRGIHYFRTISLWFRCIQPLMSLRYACHNILSFLFPQSQLELHFIMARKGKPLSDDTRIAIIRMFHSGYNKKDIMKALDIGEGSFWRTLKQWQTNCHFCKHLTRETRGRPRKMGIIESSVCHSCINCICQLINCDLVPGAQNYFHP